MSAVNRSGPSAPRLEMLNVAPLDFLALQPPLEAALDAILSAARNLRQPQALHIMNHRHQQAIVDGHHQTNVRTGRRHDAGVGRVRIPQKRGVHGGKLDQRPGHGLQQVIRQRQRG
jgi:hypothetical protein